MSQLLNTFLFLYYQNIVQHFINIKSILYC